MSEKIENNITDVTCPVLNLIFLRHKKLFFWIREKSNNMMLINMHVNNKFAYD